MAVTVTTTEKTLIDRMKQTNDYIVVGIGNIWWCNENHKGAIIEALSSEEKDALWSLESKGILKKETKTYQL